jgi:hypothetical protein
MAKTRINVSLDQDLAEFAKVFAAENRTSVADIVTQYLLALKRRVEGEHMETILSHRAFEKAMVKVQGRLRNGTAQCDIPMMRFTRYDRFHKEALSNF